MSLYLAIVFGLVGGAVGYFIPSITLKIVIMKQKQRNQELVPHISEQWGIKLAAALLNGIIWGLVISFETNYLLVGFISCFTVLAIMFTLIDWRIHIVPNELILVSIVLGVLYQLFGYGLKSLGLAMLCMLALLIIFVILGLIMGLNKIGAGDVKLVATMGLILGYPSIVSGILAMSVILLLFIFIGMLSGKMTHVSMFAFAPFMMFGLLAGLLYGIAV